MIARIRPLVFVLLLSPILGYSQKIQHPLDPLNWQEYWVVTETLVDAGHFGDGASITSINLQDPGKDFVLGWHSGEAIPRKAQAIVRQKEKTFRAVVDIDERKMLTWKLLEGIQPSWNEFGSISKEVLEHPEVIEALKRRGINDTTLVNVVALGGSYFGVAEEEGRRIGHVFLNHGRGIRNTFHEEIGGLMVVADMNTKEILRVIDEGPVSGHQVNADYDRASIGPSREVPGPLFIYQPNGPGFTLDGHVLEWQKWKFHLKPDMRFGTVVSTVSYQDGGESRSVMYQGHFSEMFVPYMDPAANWYVKNFFDGGEYSTSGLTKPLVENVDCPPHAYYMDAVFVNRSGRPLQQKRMIGIFEREIGSPSWRHAASPEEGGPEGRIKRELVLRSAAVIGNYDYIFDWIFRQDGSIKVAVGATGIVASKQTEAETVHDTRQGDPDAYGRMVAPGVVGVNHDHYFSYRLDMDVDGKSNNLSIDKLRTRLLPEDHPRRSVWTVQSHIASKESDAKMNINFERPAIWRVTNARRENGVGHPTSYQLKPGSNGATLLSEDDYPRRRAGFINHHLWATAYDPSELYAAGEFPTFSTPGMGLPNWTKQNRAIANTDIVLWYTIVMHHIVRAEDWPVMPVAWHSFELRPFDFFDRNPALDLPK